MQNNIGMTTSEWIPFNTPEAPPTYQETDAAAYWRDKYNEATKENDILQSWLKNVREEKEALHQQLNADKYIDINKMRRDNEQYYAETNRMRTRLFDTNAKYYKLKRKATYHKSTIHALQRKVDNLKREVKSLNANFIPSE